MLPAEGREAMKRLLATYRAQRNDTRSENVGRNSTGKDDLKIRGSITIGADELGRDGFECRPMSWIAEVLNSDEAV